MKKYHLTGEKTKVYQDSQSIVIETPSTKKMEESVQWRVLRYALYLIMSVACFFIAYLLATIGLYSVTISCERDSPQAVATCSIDKNYYFQANEQILINQPTKEIYLDHDDDDTCGLELETVSGRIVLPFGSISSTAQCNLEIDAIEDLVVQSPDSQPSKVGQETITVSDNFIFWFGAWFLLGIGLWGMSVIFKKPFMVATIINTNTQTVTIRYIKLLGGYEEEYDFADISHINISSHGSDSGDSVYTTLALKTFIPVLLNLEGEKYEVSPLVDDINQILNISPEQIKQYEKQELKKLTQDAGKSLPGCLFLIVIIVCGVVVIMKYLPQIMSLL